MVLGHGWRHFENFLSDRARQDHVSHGSIQRVEPHQLPPAERSHGRFYQHPFAELRDCMLPEAGHVDVDCHRLQWRGVSRRSGGFEGSLLEEYEKSFLWICAAALVVISLSAANGSPNTESD